MTTECVSIILPVYNEEGNIAACLRGLTRALQGVTHEILVCYDFDEDTTLSAIARMEDKPAALKLVRNTLGRGAAAAIRAGFQSASGDVLVTTMADLSDPPEVVLAMVRKIRDEGADVVSGSRYMKGGSQTGGPRLKTVLSRAAGLSLRCLAGLGTHDATTNFRAYSRRFVDAVDIRSRFGMELALELTVKAHVRGFKVDEVPSSWQDRSAGESRFRLWTWMPRYLRWYFLALADPLFVWTVFAGASIAALFFAVRNAPVIPFWDDWTYVPVLTGTEPLSLEWLWAQHFEHRIPLAKLVWIGIARLSGADGRWATALIALLLSLSSALLLRALMRFRGQTVWTDSFVPLLLLHWDHWENLTWPFQIAFALNTLFLSLLISLILRLRRSSVERLAIPLGLCLLVLPLCGGSALPFVVLLAPWAMLVARGEPRRIPRMISVGLAAVALVLTALYFVDYRRVASGPPSSGPGRDLITALQFLTGALGHQGSRTWPGSGWLAAAALGFTLAMFLRASRRQDKEGLTARGLFLAIGGIAGLALMVGHSRSGFSPFAGFFDRYSTLSCLFPVLVYAGTEFFARPLPGRVLRIAMACLMALLFLPNARHGWDILGQRRLANETLTRDVRAGLPPAMLARIHHPWHPGTVETLEEQLRLLAEARMAIFRRAPLSDSARLWETGLVPLVDCRIALDLRHDASFSPDLDPGWHEIQIDFGRLDSSAEDLRIVAHSRGRGGRSEEIWSSALGQSPHLRHVLRIRIDEGVRLSLETQGTAGSAARIWVLLEDRRIPAP